MRKNTKHSIKKRLIIIFSSTTIAAMTLVSGIMFFSFSTYIHRYASENNLQIVKQLSQNIERNMKYMSDISILTAYDQNVMQFLTGEGAVNLREKLDNEFRITTHMGNLLAYSGIAGEINIYNLKTNERIGINRNNIFEAGRELKEQEWYNLIMTEKSYMITFVDEKDNGDINYCVARKIVDMSTGQPTGIVVIGSSIDTIRQQVESYDFGPQWGLLITDKNKNLVFSTNQELGEQLLEESKDYLDSGISTAKINGEEQLVSSLHIDSADWTVTCFIPVSFVNKDFNNILGTVTMVTIGCVILMVILVLIIVRKISGPVINLSKKMQEVKAGDFSVRVPSAGDDEIGMLSQVFNEMTERIEELITTTYVAELREKEATIKSLQAQINPHFLYNTLESIRTLAILNDDYDTAKMIATLGKFLRFKISKKGHFTYLKDELEYVRDYIAIMQMKYDGKIKFEMYIEEGLDLKKVSKLIVQPVVENCIIHGFRAGSEKGSIEVRAYSGPGKIFISVRDDGAGMEEEALEQLKKRLLCAEEDTSKSIGLKNVYDRILMEFGGEFGLHIQSWPGNGTEIVITLPDLGDIEEV